MSGDFVHTAVDDADLTDPRDEEAPRGFRIADERQAAFAIESILVARHRLELRKASLAAMEKELASIEKWFTPLLEDYYTDHPPPLGSKTLKFDVGSLSRRTVPGGIRIEDEEACVAWCKEHLPDGLREQVIHKLDRERVERECERLYSAELAAAFAASPVDLGDEDALGRAEARARGALPPGVTVVPDRESFSIKPPKGA